MKLIERYQVASQWYLIPTIRITTDKWLYGYRNIEVMWLNQLIELKLGRLES